MVFFENKPDFKFKKGEYEMSKNYYRLPSGTTGHLFEIEILGECRVSWSGYMKWNDAKELARRNQPWSDPTNPTCSIARQFRNSVVKSMGLSEREQREVRLYTAVHTPFDVFHGVDGWFEFNGIVVTIDVTTNSHKDSCKADVLITANDLGDDDCISQSKALEVAQLLCG